MLEFSILSATSRDQELAQKLSSNDSDTSASWFTKKNHSFPQSLVLKLDRESHVAAVKITAHKDFLPSSLTVSLGVPNPKYGTSKSYHADYDVSKQLTFRESLHLEDEPVLLATFDAPALFIRITVHGYFDEDKNVYGQIGLIAINVLSNHDEAVAVEIAKVEPKNSHFLSPTQQLRKPQKEMPMKAQPKTAKTTKIWFESDEEDEEILFSKDMVTRLNDKSKKLQESWSDSKTVDKPVKESSLDEKDKLKTPQYYRYS
ncbi:unnamed protein product [Caenorhabditis auriculariae]|uniref:Centrosomal protein CEP104 N-terminal domain-containing protein n=1 Tax=Caenorhabditis auriculariae TaxID=2777116 RepID=A0A8S1HY42_9PELO|nr:unnamed protein product [Caenorhabditis auriculariae]